MNNRISAKSIDRLENIIENMLSPSRNLYPNVPVTKNFKLTVDTSELRFSWMAIKKFNRFNFYFVCSGKYNYIIFPKEWNEGNVLIRGKMSEFIESLSYIEMFVSIDEDTVILE